MTAIGLISDVHAKPEPVEEALSIFKANGVERIFCAGDIAGYHEQLHETINLLKSNDVETIVGNHDLHYLAKHEDETDCPDRSFLKQLPVSLETIIENKNVYMVHAQPPDGCHGGIKLLDKKGAIDSELLDHWTEKIQSFNYDVLIIGHTHQVFVEKMGGTLVINPGSSVFNHCCAILRLPEMKVKLFALSGKKIEPTWNWGEYMIYGKNK